ncbi:MAG: electron transfer flavoprotein subunit beta/FixA family protein [Deltaproteobacteria bacterium]|nr:electron transfer flavoprotein subunit beta/FixA family protein [Deltaproteobacteria bacterium]
MKLLVCVKQIPDPDAPVHVNADGRWVDIDGGAYVMNRFDGFALEEALRIREEIPDTRIDVISVGPERVEAVLRRSLGMGADHGIHILNESDGYLSPFATATWIAAYARACNYDLILTGVMSGDDMNGQVGPLVAEMLRLPCATSVIFRRLMPDSGRIYVEREMEGRLRDALEIKLPVLLTLQSGINQPRYPSLSRMLRANRHPLDRIPAGALESPFVHLSIMQAAFPQKVRAGLILEGTSREKACQLLDIIQRYSMPV